LKLPPKYPLTVEKKEFKIFPKGLESEGVLRGNRKELFVMERNLNKKVVF